MPTRNMIAALLFLVTLSFDALSQQRAIPDDARRHFIRGQTAFQEAKSEADMAVAAQEFASAARIAPWWPDAYWNQALALDKANRFADAIAAFKKFIEVAPNHPDVQKAKDQMFALEFKQERAQEARAAADRRSAEEAHYGYLIGTWHYTYKWISMGKWVVSDPRLVTFARAGDHVEGTSPGTWRRVLRARTDTGQIEVAHHFPAAGAGTPCDGLGPSWEPVADVQLSPDKRELTFMGRTSSFDASCRRLYTTPEPWTLRRAN